MPLGSARTRAPSLHRGGRHRAHCPRRESGDAPARGTRRGKADGMAPRRHLTAFTGRARASGYNSSQLQKTWRGRTRWRAPRCPREAGHRRRVCMVGNRRAANADRGDGPARRRIPGSRACPRVEHALQRSVAQSKAQRSRRTRACRHWRQPTALRWAGARSRVAIQDGVARRPPRRSRRRIDVRRTPWWTFIKAPRRKTRDGIDGASGSPDVLPKEGTSDRLHAHVPSRGRSDGGLGSNVKTQSPERAARRHGRATGVSEARSVRAASANNRAPYRRIQRKRATTS